MCFKMRKGDCSYTLIIIIIISLFAHSETMIVSITIEHSKTDSKYKYNKYIQQYITV